MTIQIVIFVFKLAIPAHLGRGSVIVPERAGAGPAANAGADPAAQRKGVDMSSGKKFSADHAAEAGNAEDSILERVGLVSMTMEQNPEQDRDMYTRFKKLPLRLSVEERVRLSAEISRIRQQNGLVVTYQELVMHSTYVDAHRDISGPGDATQLHNHSFVEVLYCIAGDMEYLLGTKRYRIRRGDVVIIPPGVSHEPLISTIRGHEYYERIVIWISAAQVARVRQIWPEEDWSLFETPPEGTAGEGCVLHTEELWDPLIHESFERLVVESEHELPGWEPAVSGGTLTLMVLLTRAISRKGRPVSDSPELIDRIISYVEDNMAGRITLEETARYFLISESTLSKTFRTHMDTSFYQFVKQRRLNAAKSLLAEDITLSEIPEQVGFCDYASFYRAFKKEYQLTPSQYRDLVKSGEAEN